MAGVVALAGYTLRYRPLSEPGWTVAPTDDYTLQYICVRGQEGRLPWDWNRIIVHSAECRDLQMDGNIGVVYPDCRIEGTRQVCTEPRWEASNKVASEDLEPGNELYP